MQNKRPPNHLKKNIFSHLAVNCTTLWSALFKCALNKYGLDWFLDAIMTQQFPTIHPFTSTHPSNHASIRYLWWDRLFPLVMDLDIIWRQQVTAKTKKLEGSDDASACRQTVFIGVFCDSLVWVEVTVSTAWVDLQTTQNHWVTVWKICKSKGTLTSHIPRNTFTICCAAKEVKKKIGWTFFC